MTGKNAALAIALIGLFPIVGLDAQTATTGTLTGSIRGLNGSPVEGVEVTLIRPGEGWERVISANREGHFNAGFLSPGEYEVFVERLGYVPVHVRDILIRSGRHAIVDVSLRESPPPVTEVDRVAFGQVGRELALSTGRSVTRRDIRATPYDGRELTGILSRWTLAGEGHQVQGLPGRYTVLDVDGIRYAPASHSVRGPGFLHLAAFPTFFLQDVELVPQGIDAEWGDTPGGMLRATTVQGTDRLDVEGFGSAMGTAPLTSAAGGSEGSATFGPEAGVLVRGPIRADTAHFAVGLQARQAVRPIAPTLGSEAAGTASLLDRSGLPADGAGTWNVISGFGRMDWRFGPTRTLTLRSHLGVVRGAEGDLGSAAVLPPEGGEGTDFTLGGNFFTEIGERGAFEARFSIESSEREFGAFGTGLGGAPPPRSWIQEGGMVAGAGPLMPGTFSRSAIRLSPIVHQVTDSHHIKGGLELTTHQYEERAAPAPGDGFLFADTIGMAQGLGLRLRTTGPAHDVGFRRAGLGLFVQDRWTPAEGLTVTGGVRMDGEILPWDDILTSGAWEERTGFDRADDRSPKGRISPRIAVEWTPGTGEGWLLSGSYGIHHGEIDPALMAEMLADSGSVRVQRTLGQTGAWPAGGTAAGLSSEGARMSIMATRFDAPRTQATEAALVRTLGGGVSVELGFAHRFTDFLPRRRDLNRVPNPLATDQFGRPIFGEVVREEGLVTLRPGSDRRFSDFDVVSGLESDGWSEWWGISAGLSHRSGGPMEVEARYTFSDTRDNLPGLGAGWPSATRGRPAPGGGEPAWVEGRSDLDVPHRLAVTGSYLVMPEPAIRLGALWAYHSGAPFTPGVRDALDGTSPLGWEQTAPITVPASLAPELDALRASHPCLEELLRGAAARNGCRTEGVHELNLRLGATLRTAEAWQMELIVDGLNLLDSGRTIPDPAVFVVDGTRAPGDVTNGVIELPVRVNPAFGDPLVRLSTGRSLRIGIGVRH